MIRRLVQAWCYATARPGPEELRRAALLLSAGELAVFRAMSAPDQAHGCRVARRLADAGAPRAVVAAAILHDAGKPRGYGLLWRSLAVLWPGDRPQAAPPALTAWARARQVYHWHDQYGAAALERAGAAPEVAALVRGDASHPWADALRQADDLG